MSFRTPERPFEGGQGGTADKRIFTFPNSGASPNIMGDKKVDFLIFPIGNVCVVFFPLSKMEGIK